MKVCKNCGEINPNDSTYCCSCGKNSFVYQEEVACPFCGAPNDKSFDHCINCGNLLKQPLQAQEPSQHEEQTQPVAVNLRDELPDAYGGITVAPGETAVCPGCGANVPLTAVFCSKCGAPVASLHEHRVVRRKICPHCHRPNDNQAHFCSYCYTSLATAETEEMQVVHESTPLGDTFVKQAYLEDASGKKKVCPNCNTINTADELFCVNCGLKLDVDEPKKYCPNCGAENTYDSTFCSKCRWSFDGKNPDEVKSWTCPHCNRENDTENNFCSNCGTKKE